MCNTGLRKPRECVKFDHPYLSKRITHSFKGTVWWVIFGGANIRKKLKVAVRINFRGFNFCDWMTHAYACIRSTRCACMVCMHAPLAMCMLLTIELAAVPTLFAELWRGFLSTLVCEAIMSIMIFAGQSLLTSDRAFGVIVWAKGPRTPSAGRQ